MVLKPKIIRPYDYQAEGIDQIRSAFARGYRRVLYQLPTGGGKTAVFGFITKYTSERKKTVWIIAHRDNLVRQAGAALDDMAIDHGFITRSAPIHPKRVQVCSAQTLIRRLERIPQKPDLIVIDESHHAAGKNTWTKIIEAFPNAFVLGVTATPTRLDGKGLGTASGGLFDMMICGPTMVELISRGKIVPLRCFEPEKIDTSSLKITAGDFNRKEVGLLMDKPKIVGSVVNHYRRFCENGRTIVFCPSIQMAEHVVSEFKANGIQAALVHGGQTSQEQWSIIKALEQKRIMILASVDVISEGTDIPAVEAGIMMRPTMSTVIFLQQAGRIMRSAEGKKYGILVDMVGNIDRHGLPEMDREWSLEGETKEKRKKKKKEEESANLQMCPECLYKHPKGADRCPLCGAPIERNGREYEQVDGELCEITDARKAELEARLRKKREQGQAKSLVDLYLLANARGHKWNWAVHIYESRNKVRLTALEKRNAMREAFRILGK